ncbi:MAG: hypothetical protein OER21_12635 [Gemmatimonadota bacterium]|nr:hypothetical protein [Gemmatimonadota bacterium]
MFIELAEHLRCPVAHEDAYLVLATGAMAGRSIRIGTIGCPVCQAEYVILDGVARFGPPPAPAGPTRAPPAPATVQALLALESPGGYVVLVGSAAALTEALSGLMPGVHFVLVNPVPAPLPAPGWSVLECAQGIPLATMARGIVVGGEYGETGWLTDAARVVLRGQRAVVLSETPQPPPALERMVAGEGMWVGTKR